MSKYGANYVVFLHVLFKSIYGRKRFQMYELYEIATK